MSNVYKVKVSPERYACYTSNADENSFIYDTYNQHKNMELALREFVERFRDGFPALIDKDGFFYSGYLSDFPHHNINTQHSN